MSDASYTSSEYLGPYELRGELGEGAMAVVWRAWDPNLDREVAIKEPKLNRNEMTDEIARRFVKEAKTAARLNHPNIVTIFAADVYDGRPAIVMELVEGVTLSDLLDNGPLAPAAALEVADQLLDAVGYAHQHGVVHRDIKPDNIFIDANGHVKLADFGIARLDDDTATRATMMGTVLGTPQYMSPEQAIGNEVDARSDLFSIGIVIYEMLTGSNPFGGANTNPTTVMYRIAHEPAPELEPGVARNLDADLRPAVMAALAKDPYNRPQTAADFKAMLHGAPVPRFVDGGVRPGAGASSSELKNAVSKASGNNLSKYLPYLIVGAVGVVVIIALFVAGNAGGGGAAGGSVSDGGAASSSVVNEEEATELIDETLDGGAYLAVTDDGHIAVYEGAIGNGADPKRVTGLLAKYLDKATQKKLKKGIAFDSVEAAEEEVAGYKLTIEEGMTTAESESSSESSGSDSKSEPEPTKPATPTNDTVEITVLGRDGTTRTATIRREGSSERVFADSNYRYLTSNEVAACTDAERCVAWNEIIAADTGYSFKNGGLRNYFTNHCTSWYVSRGGSGGTEGLTDAGRANVSLLKDYTSDWWKNLSTD